MKKHKIIIAITGASGSLYAKVLLDKILILKDQVDEVGILMSDNAKYVWQTELDNDDYKKYHYLDQCNLYQKMTVIHYLH